MAEVNPRNSVVTKAVDSEFVTRQRKILSFFEQFNYEEEYYNIGKEYDIEANIDFYNNKKIVEEFLVLYRNGFLSKLEVFSVFNDRMRREAIALFNILYHAKDFEIFYKTAAFARVHLNEYQFLYAFYVVLILRADIQAFVVPAPYEVYPEYFTNSDIMLKAYRIKMQDGILDEKLAKYHGVVKENGNYIFYANFSNYRTYGNEEQRLSYFTEDIGMNAYYYNFHTYAPFWVPYDKNNPFKKRRGEAWYYFYQQVLARYYMERLANGLGEIPEFSWSKPIKNGYTPSMTASHHPFIQRNDNYTISHEKYSEELQFLDAYEKNFISFLQRGEFSIYGQEVDFKRHDALNFVGNYWQTNPDLYENMKQKNYHRSYDAIACHLLSAAPKCQEEHTVAPSALSFYQTSLRDPMYYQLYNRLVKYSFQYKEHLEPYNNDHLHFAGVKIVDVFVDKLVTYFEFFDYDITNGVYKNNKDVKEANCRYIVRQPRLNQKPFDVTIDIHSDIEREAGIKIFLGPKYDSNGVLISLKDNWKNFFELDFFKHKLTRGQNKIVRHSKEFFYFQNDTVSMTDIYKYLDQGEVPKSMSEDFEIMPRRFMLPRGTVGGFPYQLFVYVYAIEPLDKKYEYFTFMIDDTPFGYPFERPVNENFFKQSNIIFKDVNIFFEGEPFAHLGKQCV